MPAATSTVLPSLFSAVPIAEVRLEFVFIGGMLLFFVAVFSITRHFEKKRSEEHREVAEANGYKFDADGVPPAPFQSFHLPTCGSGQKCLNQHTIAVDAAAIEEDFDATGEPIELSIFDWRYTTGSGKNRTTHNQTVAVVLDPSLTVPAFTLGRENVFHRIGGLFGYQDIDFDDDPAFSKAFLLRSEEEAIVRVLFDESLRNTLTSCTIKRGEFEACPGAFLVYGRSVRLDPGQIPGFADTALELHRELRAAAARCGLVT